MKFRDKNELLHANPVKNKDICDDNSILYTIEEYLLITLLNLNTNKDRLKKQILIHENSTGSFIQTPCSFTKSSSHDNVTAITSISYKLGWNFHKELKILDKFWHPRDILFYNYLKGGINRLLVLPFMWIHFLLAVITCKTLYKRRPDLVTVINCILKEKKWLGQEDGSLKSLIKLISYRIKHKEWPNQRFFIKTDGELLMWVKFQCVKMPITELVCKYLMKKKWKTNNPYAYMFETFFPIEEHPIRILVKELYGQS